MKRNRNSIKYRVFHYFNTLTHEDWRNFTKLIGYTISDFLAMVALLVLLYIIPAVFR